jgi:hypothetical protein
MGSCPTLIQRAAWDIGCKRWWFFSKDGIAASLRSNWPAHESAYPHVRGKILACGDSSKKQTGHLRIPPQNGVKLECIGSPALQPKERHYRIRKPRRQTSGKNSRADRPPERYRHGDHHERAPGLAEVPSPTDLWTSSRLRGTVPRFLVAQRKRSVAPASMQAQRVHVSICFHASSGAFAGCLMTTPRKRMSSPRRMNSVSSKRSDCGKPLPASADTGPPQSRGA